MPQPSCSPHTTGSSRHRRTVSASTRAILPCQSGLVSPRDPNTPELRAVAPLVVLGDSPRLVGPVTLVRNGARVIGVTSAEVLRTAGDPNLHVALSLDGTRTVEVANWTVGRYAGVGLVELEVELPESDEVVPLNIGSVNASVDVHGAPAAIVTVEAVNDRFERSLIPIHVDGDDVGGMSDSMVYLASPHHPAHSQVAIEGACVFGWLPPEPALGRRTSEVVAFALAYPYRAGIAKPRATPVFAELSSLEDLGRALIGGAAAVAEKEPELPAVTGEIDGPE